MEKNSVEGPKLSLKRSAVRTEEVKERLAECTCDSECEPGASNINCAVHGVNPDYKGAGNEDSDPVVQDVGAETIGAIKEYHGHKKFDINTHVGKPDGVDLEDELMRTALNGVLHMGSADLATQKYVKELAGKVPLKATKQTKPTKVNRSSVDKVPEINKSGKRNSYPNSDSAKARSSLPKTSDVPEKTVHSRSQSYQSQVLLSKFKKKSSSHYRKKSSSFKQFPMYNSSKMVKTSYQSPKPARILRKFPDTVEMPRKAPPLGYRWSYQRIDPEEESGKLGKGQTNKFFRWVLKPVNLSLKRKRSFDYLRDAKYGRRSEMNATDFSVVNHYNFPPYCYSITEPLRFPYHNFNSPPFPKRAPLYFTKFYDEKVNEDSGETIQRIKEGDVKLNRADIRRYTQEQIERSAGRYKDKSKEDPDKPKYIEHRGFVQPKWVNPVRDTYVSIPEPIKPKDNHRKRTLSQSANRRKSTKPRISDGDVISDYNHV